MPGIGGDHDDGSIITSYLLPKVYADGTQWVWNSLVHGPGFCGVLHDMLPRACTQCHERVILLIT